MNFTFELDILLLILPRILVATICGFLVGWDREKKKKVAGLRTMVLISVGTCIFVLSALICSKMYNISDPSRIISTIITGIGFLGAGVIMKHDDKIVGVTTASFIWVIAGIGIMAGLGIIIMPIFLTFGLLFISSYFEKLERYIQRKNQ